MKGPNDRLEALANRIARETMEVWETHVRQGQQAVVESHQESFSVLARVSVRPGNHSVIEHLTGLLGDEDKSVFKASADLLGKIGKSDSALVDALSERLEDEDPEVRRTAVKALGRIGITDLRTLEILTGRLRTTEDRVRYEVIVALGKIGSSGLESLRRVLRSLTDFLEDSENGAAFHFVASILDRIDLQQQGTKNLLVDWLDMLPHEFSSWYRERPPRSSANDTIGDKNIIGSLRLLVPAAYSSPPGYLVSLIGRIQGEKDAAPRSSATAVHEAINDPDLEIPTEALGILINQLEGDDEPSRWWAARTLERINSSDPAVIESLTNQLDNENEASVRLEIVEALGKICSSEPDVLGNSDVFRALTERLEDGYSQVRRRSAEALGEIGVSHPAVTKALTDRLGDEIREVRMAAAEALGRIGASDPAVIDSLVDRLDDEKSGVRQYAAEALGQIAPFDPAVIEALIGQLEVNEEDSWAQEEVVKVLRKIGFSDPSVTRTLVDSISDESSRMERADDVLNYVPWHVFAKNETREETRARLAQARQEGDRYREALETEDGKHLIVHWQELACLPE